MTLSSSLDTKEQVRQATDIVELVGSYIALRREGRIYKGLCPWHDDRRPSMQVNPERQTFKCWVCDIGGDVFSFMMRREGVEFPEALEMLADRAGIQLGPKQSSAAGTSPAKTKQRFFQAAAWAESEFHHFLLDAADAEPARQYLAQRGITQESIRHFHIGYAPNEWDWLAKRGAAAGFQPQELESVGLLATSSRTGRRYDRFKGRVLFSIRDAQQRPVAMGGRILPELADENAAKYINSPETPLFSKSNQLYGLDVARDAISKTRHAIVTEGYTDCIVAHQAGFQNVLAVLGTALGERHVQLLARYADKVTLVLDGDEAGQRRANEILDLFVASRLNLCVLTLPDGLDPCDFLLERGSEPFASAVESAVDALDHKIRIATRGIDAHSGSHDANRALEDIMATLARAPRLRAGAAIETKLREDQFLARIAREFVVPEETLRARLASLRRSATGRPPAAASDTQATPPTRHTIADPWERELIEILLQEPEAISEAAESIRPEQLLDPICRQIFAKCCDLSAAGTDPALDRLLLEFDDPQLQNVLVDLDERGRDRGGSDLVEQLPDVLESFRRRAEEREVSATTAALKEKRFDASEEVAILQELLQQKRARHRAT